MSTPKKVPDNEKAEEMKYESTSRPPAVVAGSAVAQSNGDAPEAAAEKKSTTDNAKG
ncbi:hypothetical protein [Longimicrobium sp.]|uniref:hypothetical protein n=1 Tax=Longimicrobium sp. TaxID=2029185 RepID=UPI002F93AEC2